MRTFEIKCIRKYFQFDSNEEVYAVVLFSSDSVYVRPFFNIVERALVYFNGLPFLILKVLSSTSKRVKLIVLMMVR